MDEESKIKSAMDHPDRLGEGAKKRRKSKLTPDQIVKVVMKEFKRGTLFSGSGEKVKDERQALAIAISEAHKAKNKRENA